MFPPNRTLLLITDSSALSNNASDTYKVWLNEAEQQRYTRFLRAERRRQFLAGRALLRLVLSRLIGEAPAAIVLRERPGQAPALVHPAAPAVGFSISHAGPWVACAASTETALGLDIERIDPRRDVLALAEQAFRADEIERLWACAAKERPQLFYRMWCELEARIKLGGPTEAMYYFERPGLAAALACARPLAAAPSIEIISLELH